jgi:23S rRNA G2069 N7-methylase RlmK/C1962 C5-methylase RlmI
MIGGYGNIADKFGHLTPAQVYAALAYYHANREEIEADIAAEEAEAERLEQEHLRSRQKPR